MFTLTPEMILAAIRENRNAFRYWTRKEFPGIAQNHADNISDLRIMLLQVRFPNHPAIPFLTFGADFTPVIVTVPDTIEEIISESDRNALADAIADETEFATGEMVPAGA